MYLYKDLTAPTAVNHCLCAKITTPNRLNLVVAKSTLIQVFSFETHDTDISDPSSINTQSNGSAKLSDSKKAAAENERDELNPSIYGATDEESFLDMSLQPSLQESQQKLILITEYKLNGIVSSLGKIPSSTLAGHDCLILATESAKLSVLEWDPDSNVLTTLSLHYYELSSLKTSSGDSSDFSSFLRVDYSTSLACLKFNKDMLAFLPFRRQDQDLLDNDISANTDGANNKDSDLPKLFLPSFAVSAFKLDSTIAHIADTAFLYEYREPTLAILSSPRRTCTGLLEVTRDNMSLVVIALDVVQKASTTILSVQDLAYDLHTIVPLPQPVGGLVLLGCNELIHIDQSGRVTAVAVNKFTDKTSGMDMVDKSSLNLYLEDSRALWVDDLSRLLLVTKDGRLFWIKFEMDGRTVSQLVIEDLHIRNIERLPSPSCLIHTPENSFFLGSTTGDSFLVGYVRRFDAIKNASNTFEDTAKSAVKLSKPIASKNNNKGDEDEDLYGSTGVTDDYDELYGEAPGNGVTKSGSDAAIESPKDISFSIWDRCINHGPIIDMAVGKPSSKGVLGSVEAEIVVSRGAGVSSGLSCFRQSLIPDASGRFSIPNSTKLWAISVTDKDTTANGAVSGPEAQDGATEADAAAAAASAAPITSASSPIHRYLAVDRAKSNQTLLLDISSSKIKDVRSSFDTKCSTVAMGNLLDSSIIIQCTPNELRIYDSDLQQTQKLPLFLSTEEESKVKKNPSDVAVKSCKFCDPYVVVTLSDESFKLYVASRPSYKLEPLHLENFGEKAVDVYITETKNKFLIHKAQKMSGKRKRNDQGDNPSEGQEAISMHIALFITTNNRLDIFDIANSKHLFSSGSSIGDLPLIIENKSEKEAAENAIDNNSSTNENKEDPDSNLCEILLVELGDIMHKQEYLILRTASNEICLYEPFFAKQGAELKFQRISSCNLARYKSNSNDKNNKGSSLPVSLQYLPDVADYGLVFVKGERPFWIIKTRQSMPHFVPHAHKDIVWVSPFNTPNVSDGFIILDKAATVVINSLPSDFSYDGSWPAKTIDLPRIDGGVYGLSYHEDQNVYSMTLSKNIPFHAVDEDGDLMEGAQNVDDKGTALSEKGKLQLISPISWICIDDYEFQENEVPLAIKTVELQYSERSTATKEYIAIGTGVMRGEDLAMRGSIYLFEVISVVPKPDELETKNKLKLVVKEDVKGAVSSICAVNGYLMAAQGQKVMVRSLQEDRSILPVAFIDVNAYMTDCKSIQNLIIMTDVFRSLWFVGFSFEPYALTLFGKDSVRISGVCADFLVDKSNAAFLMADDKGHLHVLQYDPEDPRSLSGQRLLRKSVFQVGTQVQTMRMVPRAGATGEKNADRYMCLGGTGSGNLVVVTPVDESAYRHLHVVGQQLSDHRYLPHIGGLNPRVFRQPTGSQRLIDLMNSTSVGDVRIKRPILDGNIIWRFVQEVDNCSRREIARRVGRNSLAIIWDEMLSIAESLDYL